MTLSVLDLFLGGFTDAISDFLDPLWLLTVYYADQWRFIGYTSSRRAFSLCREKLLHLFHPCCEVIQLNCCCIDWFHLSDSLPRGFKSFQLPNFCIFLSLFFVKFLADLVYLSVVTVAQIVGAMLESRDVRIEANERILARSTELLCWNRLRNDLLWFLIRRCLNLILIACFDYHSSLINR